jgi:PhnB protein
LSWPDTPAFLRLYVDDADALLAGAIVPKVAAISDVPLLAIGDLVGRVRDPFGNIWWLQTHVEDVSEKEMAKRGAEPNWQRPWNICRQR